MEAPIHRAERVLLKGNYSEPLRRVYDEEALVLITLSAPGS